MQETRQIARSAGAFFSGTFLSRLTGFGRDLAMAICFGATPAVAAFMVAFRFANLARRLFGESPLTSSFIPHFETLRQESDAKAQQFFCDFFVTLLLVLLAIVGCIMWLLPTNEVGQLTKLMLPGLIFVCLFGLSSAYLQCEKKFFLSSASPIVFNLVWIGAVISLRDHPDPMPGLCLAVVAGFALQWLMSVTPLLGLLRLFRSVRLFSPEVRQTLVPFALGILGVGASQINSALDALFARWACLEGPAYLWYAIRLQQLPLVLFGMAWSSALLPTLVRSENKLKLLKDTITKCAHFLIPITFAIFPCAGPAINLLYCHGSFSQEAAVHTSHCLWAYGLGLFPAALVMMLTSFYYAQKDYKTPSKAAAYAVLVNIVLNSILVFGLHLGAVSVAIATSCSQVFNALYLMRGHSLDKKLRSLFGWSVIAATVTLVLYHEKTCATTLGAQVFELIVPFAVFCSLMGVLFYRNKLT